MCCDRHGTIDTIPMPNSSQTDCQGSSDLKILFSNECRNRKVKTLSGLSRTVDDYDQSRPLVATTLNTSVRRKIANTTEKSSLPHGGMGKPIQLITHPNGEDEGRGGGTSGGGNFHYHRKTSDLLLSPPPLPSCPFL